MFGWFKKKAETRKVMLLDHNHCLHVAKATLTDSGWVATDPWGELHLLIQDENGYANVTGMATIGSSRIKSWLFHTGWEVEKFLKEVDK